MKNKFLFLSLLFLPTFLIAQKKFFVEPIINPILMPIGNIGFEEYGKGYFQFDYKENSTKEFALLLGRKFFSGKWDAGVGVSHKKYRTDFAYTIRNPFTPESVFLEEEGFLNYSFYGIRLFTSYQISDRLRVRLTVEGNEPYNIETNLSSRGEHQFIFEGPNIQSLELVSFLSVNESVSPAEGPYDYGTTELNFSYTIYKKINLLVGAKCRFSKSEKFWNYRLLTYYSHDGTLESISILNDSRIYPKLLFLYAGFSYQLGFGKEMKKKKKKA